MRILETPGRSCAVSTVRLAVTDDLDMATAPAVSAAFDAVTAIHPHCVLVDLRHCPFMDATGVRCLLAAHERLRDHSGHLVLLDPAPLVRRVLRLCRADQVMEIRDTAPQAENTSPVLEAPPRRT